MALWAQGCRCVGVHTIILARLCVCAMTEFIVPAVAPCNPTTMAFFRLCPMVGGSYGCHVWLRGNIACHNACDWMPMAAVR